MEFRQVIYLSIIIPGTPRFDSRKFQSIYAVAGGCNWDNGICITTVAKEGEKITTRIDKKKFVEQVKTAARKTTVSTLSCHFC
jgi:hypothetical protein